MAALCMCSEQCLAMRAAECDVCLFRILLVALSRRPPSSCSRRSALVCEAGLHVRYLEGTRMANAGRVPGRCMQSACVG